MLNFTPELNDVTDGAAWLAVNNDGEVHLITYNKHNNSFSKGAYDEKVYDYEYILFCKVTTSGDDND